MLLNIRGRVCRYTPLARLVSSHVGENYGWNPKTNPVPKDAPWLNQAKVNWPSKYDSDLSSWLKKTNQSLDSIRHQFRAKGYAVVKQVCSIAELDLYRKMHDDMQSGKLLTPGRHDLGSHHCARKDGLENVGQIMWPSDLVEHSREGPIHARSFGLCKALLGDDMRFDFDMLIYKDAHTATNTPWHQDEAYWPEGLGDKRAATLWTALDETCIENGAMWYIDGSHKGELMEHRPAAEGSHILQTSDVSEDTEGAVCVEIHAGDAILWHGRTVHYSRGNETSRPRRTFITNYRPEAMICFERKHGFDHGRQGIEHLHRTLTK